MTRLRPLSALAALAALVAVVAASWLTRAAFEEEPGNAAPVLTPVRPGPVVAGQAKIGAPSSQSEVFAAAARSVYVVLASKGRGCGVLVAPTTIVTNAHVVGEDTRVAVARDAFIVRRAAVASVDRQRDLAWLLLDAPISEGTAIVSDRLPSMASRVYAVGAPQGVELAISEGIVSELWPFPEGTVIQTTAEISPESSGGGLFDDTGTLIGLTTFGWKGGRNANFAVPATWLGRPGTAVTPAPSRAWSAVPSGPAPERAELDRDGKLPLPPLFVVTGGIDGWIDPYNRAVTFAAFGQSEQAIDHYRESLRREPTHEALYGLGRELLYRGERAEAIEAFTQAMTSGSRYARLGLRVAAD